MSGYSFQVLIKGTSYSRGSIPLIFIGEFPRGVWLVVLGSENVYFLDAAIPGPLYSIYSQVVKYCTTFTCLHTIHEASVQDCPFLFFALGLGMKWSGGRGFKEGFKTW